LEGNIKPEVGCFSELLKDGMPLGVGRRHHNPKLMNLADRVVFFP
jgi:hypothetical protein